MGDLQRDANADRMDGEALLIRKKRLLDLVYTNEILVEELRRKRKQLLRLRQDRYFLMDRVLFHERKRAGDDPEKLRDILSEDEEDKKDKPSYRDPNKPKRKYKKRQPKVPKVEEGEQISTGSIKVEGEVKDDVEVREDWNDKVKEENHSEDEEEELQIDEGL